MGVNGYHNTEVAMGRRLNDAASTAILIGILLSAVGVTIFEYWDHHRGQSKEHDGFVREMLQGIAEKHTGLDLEIDGKDNDKDDDDDQP